MATTPEQIARYVRSHPTFAPYAPRDRATLLGSGSLANCPPQTAAELADELLEDVGFRALELGGFLSTADGELIASGVELALPSADSRVVNLALEALKLAASEQSRLTPLQAGGLVAGGLLLAWLLAAS